MVIPKIHVDRNKCLNPLECSKCLRICQQAVFKMKPVKVYKFRETDGAEYELLTPYFAMCTGCNKCVEVCPNSALNIEYIELKQGEV